MAKFYGMIGYGETTDRGDGIWEETITERPSVGDVLQNQRRWNGREELHDELVVNNQISIVADAYANDHCFNIRYATWRGTRWKVTNVEIQHPRLILTLGEVYHGPEDGSPESA